MTDTNEPADATTTDTADSLISVQLPKQIAQLLACKQCILIASDLPEGPIPIAWIGLRSTQMTLTNLEGQALVALALDKMREHATADALLRRMAQAQAEAQRGLVIPGRGGVM